MTECNGDDQAFPNRPGLLGGLTKREYFAAKALQGIIVEINCPDPFLTAARMAVVSADFLIAELNRKAGE